MYPLFALSPPIHSGFTHYGVPDERWLPSILTAANRSQIPLGHNRRIGYENGGGSVLRHPALGRDLSKGSRFFQGRPRRAVPTGARPPFPGVPAGGIECRGAHRGAARCIALNGPSSTGIGHKPMNDHASTPAPRSGGPVDPTAIEDLVAANRILADQGVLDGYGHVTMRHPHAPDRYFLSRSKAPAIITAADIMEYDLDSNPVDQAGRLMYIERFIHGEIYKARPDVNAIVHSHSPTVIPFSVSKVKLRRDLPHVRVPQAGRAEFRDPRLRRHDRSPDPQCQARRRARPQPRRPQRGADARARQCLRRRPTS